ncbi:FRIGIDA-like protein 1 [Cajanus cajan]|uniref:FRIGIDA-like protein n=1 Tax=Cajanus cajan TaxID=3821 RepID=A0A151QXR1_CAJCA|nr:FRIGIDA-like protein 1 [Cajanus cajan]KYP35094.1 Protein FRIGIDA [Cajanus cajan]
MEGTKTISAALKLVDAKKENLKKAFEDLQSHSSLLASLPLSWPQLDAHFTSLHAALSHRFRLLQSQNDLALPKTHAHHLTALCANSNATALRDYVGDHLKDRLALEAALHSALKCAPDPASLAIDCLGGVFGANAVKDDKEARKLKRTCCVLFRQLRLAAVAVSMTVAKRAKRVCAEWKASLVGDAALDGLGAMAFLLFLAAYGLFSELTPNEFLSFSATAAANEDLPELYRSVGFTHKVPGLVQKLIDRCKHVMAVRYIFEFNLADKIPPVPILKAHVNESQKLAKRLSDEGKTLNEITAREIHALKSVLKVIETHNLESEYPPESIQQRIEQLTKHKANVRYAASAFSAKPPQHQQQQSGIKRPRLSAPVASAAVLDSVSGASSTVHHYQQPHFQSSGLLPEHLNPYMSLPNMPYGMKTPTPTISPYTGASTGPYGLDGVSMGPSGNLGQGGSLPNSSEPLVPSGYYDSVSAYGGYGLQYLYPTSYPQ